MSRAHRHDPEGGWHHVMNRGLDHQRVFFTRRDGEMFESLLATAHDRTDVEVHAYCLMPNHFHLLLHCPDAGLSEFMQHLSAEYTRYLNARLDRDGPLFRGRFHSLLIDSERYLHSAGRYIHRNPLDLRPAVDLHRYRWSSLRNYCADVASPAWLNLSLIEGHDGPAGYLRFVEADLSGDHHGSMRWAIDTVIVECTAEHVSTRARIGRTVAVLMLDEAHGRARAELETILAFPTDAARRSARHRARKRLDEDRVLGDLVARAFQLAS